METSHLLQRDMHFAMCTYMISLYRKSLHTLRFISDRCRCGIAARGPGLSRSLQQTLLFQVMLFFDPFRSPYISVLWRHLVGREAEKLWSCSKTGWNVVSLSIFCWILHMDQKRSIVDVLRVNFRLLWTSMRAWTNITLIQSDRGGHGRTRRWGLRERFLRFVQWMFSLTLLELL